MNKKQEEISMMILDYLHKNPDAGDTLEGITKWWLGSERIAIAVEEVADVLEALLVKGLIKKDGLGKNTSIYKLIKRTNGCE